MPGQIELLTEQNADRVADFVAEIRQFEQPDFAGSAREPDGWDGPLREGNNRMWIFVENDEIHGTAGILDLGNNNGCVHRMYVLPDARGTGLAAKLLDTLLSWARKTDLRHVYLATSSQQRAALRFYEKHGFSRIPASDIPAELPQSGIEDMFFWRTD